MNSEIRITLTYRHFCQAARISFQKTSIGNTAYTFFTVGENTLIQLHNKGVKNLVGDFYV